MQCVDVRSGQAAVGVLGRGGDACTFPPRPWWEPGQTPLNNFVNGCQGEPPRWANGAALGACTSALKTLRWPQLAGA